MNLILKEYLSLLKESNELDKLVPDLLLAMNIRPLSQAQIGPRQYGVDVAAVGVDPDTNIKTLFLFTIKQGDINRTVWNESKVGVKDSLDDIRHVYLKNNISPIHNSLPKKIIVCTGGGMAQSVEQNWVGYVKDHSQPNISFEFWGGDKLAPLIATYLMSEHLLPDVLRSSFRKSLALIGDSDYDCSDFYRLSYQLILEPDFGDLTKTSNRKKIVKALNTLNLCTNIVFYWAHSEDNLKQAMKCAERALLNSWHIVRKSELNTKPNVVSAYTNVHMTLAKVQMAYFEKLLPHTKVHSGLCGYSSFSVLEGLNLFEQLGFLANAGIMATELAVSLGRPSLAKVYYEAICDLVNNHTALNAPLYDEHIIEIFIAFDLLLRHNQDDFVRKWLLEIVKQSVFAYRVLGHHFPISNDSYEDLISVCITGEIPKDDLMYLSTLYAVLMELCIAKEWHEEYEFIQESVKVFEKCDLQIWYPCSKTDDYLYISNAGYESGNTIAPIKYDVPLEGRRLAMKKFKEENYKDAAMRITALSEEWSALPLVASRHFRTPILPYYWDKYL